MANRREVFDRDREFIVLRPLKASGKDFGHGALFDKFLVPTRRLRQLYDARQLDMAPADTRAANLPSRPDFNALPDEAIVAWLQERGIVPRFGTAHEQLVSRAVTQWESDNKPALGGIPVEWLTMKWFELRRQVKAATGVLPLNKEHAQELMATRSAA